MAPIDAHTANRANPMCSNDMITRAINPAATSSSMMPHPPCSRSNCRHGQGFHTSRHRKMKKETNIPIPTNSHPNPNIQPIKTVAKLAIHIPTNSSQTAVPGSGASDVDILPVAQTPTKNPTTITINDTTRSMTRAAIGETDESMSCHDTKYRISAAASEPAVPGAMGEKPEPNPLPIIHASLSVNDS